jgi:hypothetical protein
MSNATKKGTWVVPAGFIIDDDNYLSLELFIVPEADNLEEALLGTLSQIRARDMESIREDEAEDFAENPEGFYTAVWLEPLDSFTKDSEEGPNGRPWQLSLAFPICFDDPDEEGWQLGKPILIP